MKYNTLKKEQIVRTGVETNNKELNETIILGRIMAGFTITYEQAYYLIKNCDLKPLYDQEESIVRRLSLKPRLLELYFRNMDMLRLLSYSIEHFRGYSTCCDEDLSDIVKTDDYYVIELGKQ